MWMLIFDFHMCWSYDSADKGLKVTSIHGQLLMKVKFEHERINWRLQKVTEVDRHIDVTYSVFLGIRDHFKELGCVAGVSREIEGIDIDRYSYRQVYV